MIRVREVAVLGVLVGCGRIGFDAGASRCDFAGALLCDDFETSGGPALTASSSTTWTTIPGASSTLPTWQTQVVHGGQRALQVNVGVGSGLEGLTAVLDANAIAVAGRVHARAWFNFPSDTGFPPEDASDPTSSPKMDLFIVGDDDDGPIFLTDNHNVRVFNQSDPGHPSRNDTVPPSSTPTTALPQDAWSCIELHVNISPDMGTVEVDFTDLSGNQEIPISGTALDTSPSGGYTAVSIGKLLPGIGRGVFYVDDVAVGTLPIPCD